jgi:hypothetical protein
MQVVSVRIAAREISLQCGQLAPAGTLLILRAG